MNEDKAREICEGIVKRKGYCSETAVNDILGSHKWCGACPFIRTVGERTCGLREVLKDGNYNGRAEAAQMFLDGEIVLVDGKLYEVCNE